MVLPVIVIPLWGKLVALSVAKKITVLLAARYYGFPRIYRKSQKTVRWLCKDPDRREWWAGYVRSVWRIPDKILYRWHNKAVKAAGVPQASLPKSSLTDNIRTALSLDRLFPGSSSLAATTQPIAQNSSTAATQAAGPSFASAPVLRQHHRELQQHRKQLQEASRTAMQYKRLRDAGRDRLHRFGGSVRSKMQSVALFGHRPGVSK